MIETNCCRCGKPMIQIFLSYPEICSLRCALEVIRIIHYNITPEQERNLRQYKTVEELWAAKKEGASGG